MASTRFSNDTDRQAYKMHVMTGMGRYALDVPGPGADLGYVQDPSIRLQKWGANLWTDSTPLQSELSGRNRPLNRDCVSSVNATSISTVKRAVSSATPIAYPEETDLTTDQSRTIMPAWQLRDAPQTYTSYYFDNPHRPVENPFRFGANTKRDMKDAFLKEPVCR